jgi:hemoglobin
MKKDITDRKDIELLVDAFYEKIKTDDVIGYLFTDVAKVNWQLHLPKMYDFWENILFQTGNYNGNPMLSHKELNDKSPMEAAHFRHWTHLFNKTVDEIFEGQKANEIKLRATNIAEVMRYKTIGK